jgi:hypothetical protein
VPRAIIPILSAVRLCICGRCERCQARRRQARHRGIAAAHWRYWSDAYAYRYFAAIARDLGGPDANLQSSFPRAHEIPQPRERDNAEVYRRLREAEPQFRQPEKRPPPDRRPREWREPAPCLLYVPTTP